MGHNTGCPTATRFSMGAATPASTKPCGRQEGRRRNSAPDEADSGMVGEAKMLRWRTTCSLEPAGRYVSTHAHMVPRTPAPRRGKREDRDLSRVPPGIAFTRLSPPPPSASTRRGRHYEPCSERSRARMSPHMAPHARASARASAHTYQLPLRNRTPGYLLYTGAAFCLQTAMTQSDLELGPCVSTRPTRD